MDLRNRTPDFLTIKEAAAMLHLSYHTLYRMIDEQRGPPVHIFKVSERYRLRRIRRSDIDKWLEEKCTA